MTGLEAPALELATALPAVESVATGPPLELATHGVFAQFDSATERLIRTLNQQLLYIAVPISLLVETILIYTVWRFRNNETAVPTSENRRLEVTWTVATALVLLFVGVASYQVLGAPTVSYAGDEAGEPLPEDAVNVTVVGQQFQWTFEYPRANTTTSEALVLPTNRTVHLSITSTDVIHAVHIPELGLKQDAIPGRYTHIRTRLTSEGTYTLYCAEYCGTGHSDMLSEVRVVSPSEYEQWLDDQRSGSQADEGTAENSTAGSVERPPARSLGGGEIA